MSLTDRPTIDVRTVVPRERHALIFGTLRELERGGSMELVNDHDPKPLYHQIQAEQPGRFAWEYLESGPETWRVRISKVANAHADGRCCGSCGGA